MNTTHTTNRIAYAQAAAVGAAAGAGNRARTFRSKRDKAACPRGQRKSRQWQKEIF